MGEYELSMNMNYWWTLGWIHHKSDKGGGGNLICFQMDMNYMWIWIMGEYERLVNMNYGWI